MRSKRDRRPDGSAAAGAEDEVGGVDGECVGEAVDTAGAVDAVGAADPPAGASLGLDQKFQRMLSVYRGGGEERWMEKISQRWSDILDTKIQMANRFKAPTWTARGSHVTHFP